MFTGIITEVGRIASCARDRGGWRVRVEAPETARGLSIGGSVAVDGVCLTAVAVDRRGFTVQIVPETAARSTLGPQRLGRNGCRVNLERPLSPSGEIGGHFVQGHVDTRARVRSLRRVSEGVLLEVELPATLEGLVVEKGSIAVNGVSLTVASVGGRGTRRFTVALIPHTLKATNLSALRAGDRVNLEADILGKYVRTLAPKRR